ncbi:hypothetical protein ACJMK2_024264 [Sinanodonta woodiana]|uniref:Uncharacterized protein n=1 Tax=Sinanodonta woodiana TaxID=1069815 RepID=A0ABD3T7R6_SINWO
MLFTQVVLFVSAISVPGVFGDGYEYRLVQDLMKEYDKRIRPSKNHTQTLNVTFGVALAQIIDVDERNQIITTNCWLNQGWLDNKLVWDPAKYGNISVIRLPHGDVWKPDILLYNNADVSSTVTTVSTNVIVTNEGNVTWLLMSIFRSSCSIDVKYFPYDVQNCSMEFASWTYDAYRLNIINIGDEGDISNYVTNSEWALLEYKHRRQEITFSCCPEPYVFVKYYIVIKRRPLFYLFNMVMPCVLITLVALLGFYMPSDSGEKISMGITTLLSITVFLMIVAESMPPTSDVVPLIGLYYGITIAIVSATTAMTVLTLNIHHKGSRGYEVPAIVKKFCFGFLAKLIFIKLDLPEPPEKGMHRVPQTDLYGYEMPPFDPLIRNQNGGLSPRIGNKVHAGGATPIDNCEQQFIRVLQKVYQTIERNEIRLTEQDRRDKIKQEWQQLALIIDRVLLICFIFLTVTTTLSVLIPNNAT